MIAISPADFRKEAEGYVRQAGVLPSGTRRFRLLDMAGSCIRLADQTEWLADATPSFLSIFGPATRPISELHEFFEP